MTYQPLQFNAVPRPYRLGNDQLRRYNRVRAGQRTQGRVNIAIDVVTILLILSVSTIVAVVELSSMPDTMLETLAALALALILGGGLILLALLAALLIVARRWHREWDGNEDLVIFSESHAALHAARQDGAVMTACARMQLAWFIGFLAVGGIAVATESALLAALVSLPLAMGLLNSWRSCQALRRITARTL
ncbi:MAG: hypothetical protein HXK07_03905 [Actinomyces sp.]|uniref:hypothetical protein n=1 Tax=Actinomyces sp. HMSC035G02 TaxID=1739406 RepID=UPI0008A96FCB|nr:hypothetical protein [Actinomyces sp. HMSC035G02]MBF0938533.1 hypothetical protein [Actinomyces sp.]MBS5722423.1 hypothetical protein [Actinomyces sp.]OHR20965.1 hypothetical protein HMPREF2902_08830 [Actinomyces sp. HMSC035G02]